VGRRKHALRTGHEVGQPPGIHAHVKPCSSETMRRQEALDVFGDAVEMLPHAHAPQED
jgi:hypothetical protein